MNHLLFVYDLDLYGATERDIDSLVNTVKIVQRILSRVSELTSIAVFTMKRGKEPQCKRMHLGNGFRIEEVDTMGYKYLELVEKDRTCQE